MAQKTIVQLIDDLDQTEVKDGGQTVTFTFQKVQYEIDLNKQNAQRLQDALAPYIAAGRRVAGRAGSIRTTSKSDPAQLQTIRRWAKDRGMKVSDRGRISAEVLAAYEASH
jgi:hypothetical protein